MSIEGLLSGIIPANEEMRTIEKNTAVVASSLVMVEQGDEEIPQLAGAVHGFMETSEIFWQLAEVLEETDFSGLDYADGRVSKENVIDNVRKVAFAAEGSYFVLKTVADGKLDSCEYHDRAFAADMSAVARERMRHYFPHCLKYPKLRAGIMAAMNPNLSGIEEAAAFYAKPSMQILLNATAERIREMTAAGVKSDRTVFEHSSGSFQGLALLARMYDAIGGAVGRHPELAFLTYDSSARESADSASKMAFLAEHCNDLIRAEAENWELFGKFKTPKSPYHLFFAEEMGPGHIRRLLAKRDDLPAEARVIAGMGYANISGEDVAAYHQMHPDDRYIQKEGIDFHTDWINRLGERISVAER